MKLTKNALAVLLSMVGCAYSASYTLTTGSSATANGFANSSGVAFQNSASTSFAGPGIVGFGVFTISDSAIMAASSATTLISAFQGFGGSPTGTFTAPGLTANRGTFSRNSTGTAGSATFNDNFMYLFVGNGTTYANSTEFAVLKTSFKFLGTDDSNPNPITYTVTTANSSILIGNTATDIRTTGTDNSVTPGFRTAVLIPEPSSAVLAALGALAMLRRRRA